MIPDDFNNASGPCTHVATYGGINDGDNDELESADSFCGDLSSVEASFTESLESFFSFSSILNVVDGFKCRCETTDSTPSTTQEAAFKVICGAVYSDNFSGEPILYTDTQEMTMYKRKVRRKTQKLKW